MNNARVCVFLGCKLYKFGEKFGADLKGIGWYTRREGKLE